MNASANNTLRPALALTLAAGLGLATGAWARLPAPSDEAKAKAAETAAKSAWQGKVDAYQLCKSMDSVAAGYFAQAKKSGKDVKPASATPPCADPGPFVYAPAPPAAAAAAAPAPAPALAAAPKK